MCRLHSNGPAAHTPERRDVANCAIDCPTATSQWKPLSPPLRKDLELRVTANPTPAALAYGWCRRGAAAFLLLIPQAAMASTGTNALAVWSVSLALLAGIVGGFLLGRRFRAQGRTGPTDGATVAPEATRIAGESRAERKAPRSERPAVRVLTHGDNQPDIDMVESVREVIFRTDDTLHLIFLNQAWGKLSGYAVQRCLGKPLIDYFHPDERERAGQLLHDVLHGLSNDAEFEFRLRTRGGEIRWVEVTCRAVGGADGAAAGLAGTIDDISVRKVAELTLRNLNQELEARVRLRTAELEASTGSSRRSPTRCRTTCAARCGPSTASPASSNRNSKAASNRTCSRILSAFARPPSAWPNSSTP